MLIAVCTFQDLNWHEDFSRQPISACSISDSTTAKSSFQWGVRSLNSKVVTSNPMHHWVPQVSLMAPPSNYIVCALLTRFKIPFQLIPRTPDSLLLLTERLHSLKKVGAAIMHRWCGSVDVWIIVTEFGQRSCWWGSRWDVIFVKLDVIRSSVRDRELMTYYFFKPLHTSRVLVVWPTAVEVQVFYIRVKDCRPFQVLVYQSHGASRTCTKTYEVCIRCVIHPVIPFLEIFHPVSNCIADCSIPWMINHGLPMLDKEL